LGVPDAAGDADAESVAEPDVLGERVDDASGERDCEYETVGDPVDDVDTERVREDVGDVESDVDCVVDSDAVDDDDVDADGESGDAGRKSDIRNTTRRKAEIGERIRNTARQGGKRETVQT